MLVLSAGVLFTANNMLGEQPTDMTAGTTTERITDYEYQTQLVSQGNAQTVEVVSPLGTHYKLTQVGDATRILAVAPNGNESQVRDMRVVGLEQQTDKRVDNEDAVQKTGEQQVLERKQVKDGIEADVIVDKYGTGDYQSIQTAINTIDSAVDRPITEDNPAVIVVERAVYKENIDVSQNISLIAEHGTIIEDAEPNENVVDITGDNTEFRNFDINGDPVPDDNHYGLHGINIEGESAEVVGNHVYNSSSPDLTSAGVNIAGDAAILKFNSVESNQRSFNFDDGAKYPFVCGNQLENTIAGQLSQRNINEVTRNNYWKEGVPVSLIPEDSNGENGNWSEVRQRIIESNNKVPVNEIPADVGRAGQPFPGTKLQAGELSGCDLQISFSNPTNTSFNIENMEIQIEGRNTTLEVVARDEVTYETGDGADKRKQTEQVVCYCGGDNEWDRNDTFELDPIEANISTNPVEAAQSVDIIRDGNAEPGDPSQPDYEEPDWERPENTEKCTETTTEGDAVIHGTCLDKTVTKKKTTQEKTDSSPETQTFQIMLGKTVEVQLADKVTMSAAVSGAQGEVGYEWSLGDGTNKSGKQVTHLYENSGSYEVCLYAWDKKTSESDSDCTTATVEEGKKDLEKIRQEEKETLQDKIDEAKEDKVIYLEEGDYDSLNIKVPGLTVIGNGDVDIVDHAEIKAEDVTVKNVDYENGVSVYQDGVKLWNIVASDSDGYGVSVDAEGSKLAYIGQSEITGMNGVSVNTDSAVTLQNNYISASGAYGVQVGNRMESVQITGNTISSDEYGIYRGHASTMYLEDNTINTPNAIYKVPNKPPEIKELSYTSPIVGTPVRFNPKIKEPQGDRISHVLWSVEGESKTHRLNPSDNFETSFDSPGVYNVTVRPVDEFGGTEKYVEKVSVERFDVELSGPNVTGVGQDVTIDVSTNLPSNRIYSYNYNWGDGESRKVPYSSQTHSYSEKGEYTVDVKVVSGSNKVDSVTKTIEIKDKPVPKIKANTEAVPVDEQVTLSASPSFIPEDSSNVVYKWDINRDGEFEETGEEISYSADEIGQEYLDLKITDSDGIETTRTVSFEVTEFSVEPNMNTITLVNSPLTVEPSTNVEADKVSHYRVRWTDSSSFTKFTTDSHQTNYSSTGVYNVTIEAVTTEGYTSTATKQVEVIEDTFGDKSLQTVVNNADSCEKVVIPAGVYNHTTIDKCITLIGSGDSTSIKGLKITNENVVVRNVQTSERIRAYASGTKLSDIYATNTDGWALDIRGYNVHATNLEVDSKYGIYSKGASELELTNSSIISTNRGLHMRSSRVTLNNLDINAGTNGIRFQPYSHDDISDLTVSNTDIKASNSAVYVASHSYEHVKNVLFKDITIDAKDVFNIGDEVYFEKDINFEGDITVNSGNGIFEFVTKGFDSQTGSVKITSDELVTEKNGLSISYPDDYLESQDTFNLYGQKYSITTDKTISQELRLQGEEITAHNFTQDRQSGYGLRVYGHQNTIRNIKTNSSVYVYSSRSSEVIDMDIDTNGNGIYIRSSGVAVKKTDISADNYGVLLRPYSHDDIANIEISNTDIHSQETAIEIGSHSNERVYNLVLEDIIFDTPKKVFNIQEDVYLDDTDTRGTLTIKNGTDAFSLVTRGYDSNSGTVTFTKTKMSASGSGPTIKYTENYVKNLNKLQLYGEKYTLNGNNQKIDSPIYLQGSEITLKSVKHTKSAGYGIRIYGNSNTIDSVSTDAGIYINTARNSQVVDSTINSDGTGIFIRSSQIQVENTDVTAGKNGVVLQAAGWESIDDISLSEMNVTANKNAFYAQSGRDEGVDGVSIRDITVDVQRSVFAQGYDVWVDDVTTHGTFTIKNGNNAFKFVTSHGYTRQADNVTFTESKLTVTQGSGPTIKYDSSYIDSQDDLNFYGKDYTLEKLYNPSTPINLRGTNINLIDGT